MSQHDGGRWFKSTFSSSSGCVEIRFDEGLVHVRDSKDPHGGQLSFTRHEWTAFLRGVENREFTQPD